LLEATLEATHDGILVADLQHRIVRYNRQFLDMFGFTADMLDHDGVDGVVAKLAPHVQNRDEWIERSRAIWRDAERESLDVIRFKDGRVFERYIAPHRIGSTVVGFVASIRDISRWVKAEEALGEHRALLEKAQQVAHIGSWVAELDGSHRLVWSAETHRIFGVPEGEFAGTSTEFFSMVHEDDRAAVQRLAAAARAGTARYQIDHRIVARNGGVRWVHERADIVHDEQGRPARMIGTVQDITDRRQLEDQLRQAQKMEAIGRLAGGIAHDLNNALTAIAGYAELALGQVAADQPARADIEEIRRAAERAGSVTKQLLAFSRNKLLEPRLFSLDHTVESIGRLLSRLLGTDIEVRTTLGRDVPSIVGDPSQLEQAILNLAVNARDAMPAGGQLTLETSVENFDEEFARAHVPMPPGRYAVLRIADTGHGMSPDVQSRIFEPFFTTKEIGKGTGLGLSMVYGTVKQIGGFIFVDSEVGRGTTFSLFFQPSESEAVAAAAPRTTTPAPSREGHEQETVLIVEDEPAVRNLVASSLRSEGYHLLLAGSAEEALVIVAAHRGAIDLLLTDAIMPGRSGIELARILTGDRPGLPVVLMSGYTEETLPSSDVAQTWSLLQKPFTPRDLRRRIREVLHR
jgi:two-component system, cell cycle sensor histidine kinase and response regulator CckA